MQGSGSALEERLLARIRAEGPITFADFMEAALYDRVGGFYARPPVGPDGDFVTSPHVSPAFGSLLARQLAECWERLGRPDPFVVAEAGAGDGTLARRILAETPAPLSGALRYVAIERSPGALAALREAGLEAATDLPAPAHVVLANELLDNLPFHRLRERDGGVVEVMVGAEDGRLAEVEAAPSTEALGALDRPLAPGEERPVSPAALAFVDAVAAAVPRGYAFLVDYGFGPGERPGATHAYASGRVTGDLLAAPGSRDLTAGVDLAALAARARAAGLQAWGPATQREALLALGLGLWIRGVRDRRAEAEGAGDHRLAARLWGEISRASILADEGKLGGLKVLVLGTEGLPAPAAASATGRSAGGTMAAMDAEMLRRLRERLEEEPDVLVAYLFGSRARGRAGPLSDVDVGVLLRDGADGPDRRLELIAAVAEVVGSDAADVLVLNDAPPALGYRVLRDGRRILCRDERARVRHFVDTVGRYHDLAPMRRIYAEGTRHRLAEGRFGRR